MIWLPQTPIADPLARLHFLDGNWESKETTQGPDGKEIPFTLVGKNSWTLNDRYLQIDEALDVPGMGKFSNHILMTFDAKAKVYRAWWFSNSAPQPQVFTGKFGDTDFVLTDTAGKMRITYHPLEAGHYKADVALRRSEKWEQITTAEYHRTS